MDNSLIIALVTFSAGLHNPMYFFLCNLATIDIICTFSVLPKALVGLLSEESTISFKGCMAQFFLLWSLSSELLRLTVMAYDHYVAICFPLHHSSRMSPQLCWALAMGLGSICAMNASISIGLMTWLAFCGPKVTTYLFCEILPHLLFSCCPAYVYSVMTFMAVVFYGGINFVFSLLSYGCIIARILLMCSAEGKRKAFSTCLSHLIVFSVYRSSLYCAYDSLATSYHPEGSKFTSVLYSLLSLTLDPLIYTLRNKDVKLALGRLLPSFSH